MKIFIICSKAFYSEVKDIKERLEGMGHEIIVPNSYNDYLLGTNSEQEAYKAGNQAEFKARMFKMSKERIQGIDAVLTLNFDKNGQKNYIGGATFLELYEAFMAGKKIYLYHDIPEGMLKDEINGFSPIVINEDLDLVK